jgi:hypothetical protein
LRQYSLRRFRHQQMYMLRHNYIPIDSKQVRAPRPLQALHEQIPNPWLAKQRKSSVATERNEMRLTGLVISHETRRHEPTVSAYRGRPV